MGVQLRELSELLRGVINYDLNSQSFHPNHYLWDDDLEISQQLVLLGHVGARGRGRYVSEMPRIGLMIGHWKADRTETGGLFCWV